MTSGVRKIYKLNEYRLDLDTQEMTREGEPVHLTNLPLQILVYLIENRDRLVSRGELLDRFWEGKNVYDDSLRKAVGAIRKALDDSSEDPRFIETRRAGGYRYIGPVTEESNRPIVSSLPSIEAGRLPTRAVRRFPRGAAVALALVLVALTTTAFVIYRKRSEAGEKAGAPVAAPIRSIAVTPLKNLTGDPNQDYLSDGLSESLITELAKLNQLKVIARSSAFAFKGKETDVREIGRRLGVGAVLEGSLRRSAENIRVTVRLINAEDGSVIWTGDSTRPLKDIIAVQDEIGCSVAESLKTVLCGEPAHKPGTGNLAAYEAYLKARDRRLKGDPKKAAELFQQAVVADPNYALAWAGLAEAYAVMEVNAQAPPRSLAGKAKECAFKAIALDSSLASPSAALGLLAAFSDRDWTAGERYFQQALAGNPNYAIAHAWYANTLLAQGKFVEAEAEYLRARELDPLNPGFLNNLAETYHYRKQSDRCLAMAAKALELDPGNEWARLNQAKCYVQQGSYDEASRVPLAAGYKHLIDLTVFAQSGRLNDAREVLPFVIKDYHRTSPYVVAIAHAILGDHEAAFTWLRKSADGQEANLTSLKIEPVFEPLRDDPRYTELLRRVGLTPR